MQKPIQSPSYPSMALPDAIDAVRKIEAAYRGSPADRVDAAKLLGFSGATGPSNMALAALAGYGLVERAGKGALRVTPLARSILHPSDESERINGLRAAALSPRLYQEIRDQFPDLPVPPEAGVMTYLNRCGFNPSAVPVAAKAFLKTARWVQELGEPETSGEPNKVGQTSNVPDQEFGGASLGDLVQWESNGTLQFETPRRVRWVSDDQQWIAVEGSETGIPMNEVTVEQAAPPKPPNIPPQAQISGQVSTAGSPAIEKGFTEWFRAKVGADKTITINFKGEGEIGPKEIEKMILVLQAQKAALED